MKRITQQRIALAITLMLAFATVAMSAPKKEGSTKYLTIEGRVLQVNQSARTLLVSDQWSKKLYLVNVPKGESFQIKFGLFQNQAEPRFDQVRRNDRVRMRCTHSGSDHLARLDDGREVAVLTAVH